MHHARLLLPWSLGALSCHTKKILLSCSIDLVEGPSVYMEKKGAQLSPVFHSLTPRSCDSPSCPLPTSHDNS